MVVKVRVYMLLIIHSVAPPLPHRYISNLQRYTAYPPGCQNSLASLSLATLAPSRSTTCATTEQNEYFPSPSAGPGVGALLDGTGVGAGQVTSEQRWHPENYSSQTTTINGKFATCKWIVMWSAIVYTRQAVHMLRILHSAAPPTTNQTQFLIWQRSH